MYESRSVLLPLGEAAGWEAGVLDHYHAVVGAFCAKQRNGQTRALPDDQLGGSTFSFDVWPGHPRKRARSRSSPSIASSSLHSGTRSCARESATSQARSLA